MDRGLISFFEIKNCGFYRIRNKTDGEHIEGSISESLKLVANWLSGRDFPQTIPWDIKASPRRSQIYCKTAYTDPTTGDSLFVFWKRFGDDSGKVSGISPDAKFGSHEGDSIKIGKKVKGQNAILGQPMYYWFIPEHNLIASINFSHSLASTEDVCSYIKRCIDLRIKHPRKSVTETEHFNHFTKEQTTRKSVVYKSEDKKYSLSYRFSAHTKELSAGRANLDKLAKSISHLVVRETISTVVEDDKDSYFKLYDLLKSKQRKKRFSKQVEITEQINLSAEELGAMLEVYREEYDPVNGWNNVGFREEQNDSTKWFNKYVNKEHIMVEPLSEQNTYHAAEKILKQILVERDDILYSMIKGEENAEEQEPLPKAVGDVK